MAVPERVLFRRKYRGLRTVVTLGWMCAVAAIALGAAWYAGDNYSHNHHRPSFGTLEEIEGGFSLLGSLDGNQCSKHMPRFVALAVWVGGVLYTFLAIAIVCDDFFVASLEAISEALDLSEDVAGATFMAAGSSAPELFSSITGVFFVENVKEDNVGPGTIVGSAVFNIAIIIGASTICAGKALNLDWWPLARDGSFYLLSIALLFVTFVVITPKQVDWFEGLLLVFFYALYIVLMKFNPRIVEYLDAKYGTNRTELEDEEMGGHHHVGDGHDDNEGVTGRRSLQQHYEFRPHVDPEAARRASAGRKPYSFRTVAIAVIAANRFANSPSRKDEYPPATQSGPVVAVENDGDEEEDEEKGPIGKALWVLSLPILYAFKLTIPNCGTERWKKWYMVSFIMSVMWIGVVSYFMVEFGIKMGRCLHLSTNVMALTVLAAGTSVPDALSSILVAKMGKGNMAVSNAIGSNVFDILLGLGLPWFLSGAIVRRTPLPINTDGILVYVAMLVIVLFVFLAIVKLSRWSISPKQGWALCALYPTYCIISLAIDKGIIPVKKAMH